MKQKLTPTRLAGKTFIFLTAVSALFTCCQQAIEDDDQSLLEQYSRSENAPANYMPNELLVKFKKETPETARHNLLARIQGKVSEKILTEAMQRYGNSD